MFAIAQEIQILQKKEAFFGILLYLLPNIGKKCMFLKTAV